MSLFISLTRLHRSNFTHLVNHHYTRNCLPNNYTIPAKAYLISAYKWTKDEPAASLHFHQFKGYILPTSQKPGSKWIKMFYFPFQIDKEGGGSLTVSLCHHQLAGDSHQDTMIGTWESFYLPWGVSALYDKTELASPKPHDPTHNRSFLLFPSLFQALDIHRLS